MIKHKFLAYPIFLLLAMFLIDKLFLIDIVKNSFKKDFTHIYYETRQDVLENLKLNYPKFKDKKKLLIILGSSRLVYFSNSELKSFYPNWEIYNLSSAVTTPAYYFYFIEKIFELNIKPDLIVLETDSNQFNYSSENIFKKSNLTYSFDLGFILKYADIFGTEYRDFYIRNTLFAVSKNKPYFNSLWQKISEGSLIKVNLIAAYTKNYLIENKGHSFSHLEDYYEKDFGKLQESSFQSFNWAFKDYKDSNLQFTFYEKVLQTLKKEKIPTIILKPQVSPPLEALFKKDEKIKQWQVKTTKLTNKYNFDLIDLSKSEEFYCNAFADGGHMGKECYRPLMRFIMSEYYRKK